jgi:methionine-rich copper-binding protein CopC
MFETHSVASISVTPDPTINDIQVNVNLKESSFVVMKISDSNGDEVMKKTAKADDGSNTFSLSGTSKLKPGNYKLEIIVNSNERMTMQLLKS